MAKPADECHLWAIEAWDDSGNVVLDSWFEGTTDEANQEAAKLNETYKNGLHAEARLVEPGTDEYKSMMAFYDRQHDESEYWAMVGESDLMADE